MTPLDTTNGSTGIRGHRHRTVSVLCAVAVVLSACSSKKADKPVVTRPAPTTTTSTVPAPTVVAPLTGAPTTDLAATKRPALVVKIDNADPAARPQLGLVEADVVYEERLEGGVTRFAAVFQSRGADPVGPVRSARMVDIPIVSALSRPLFAWSGANPGVTAAIRSAPLIDVGADVHPDIYKRRNTGGKKAPHDLYTSTLELWSQAPDDRTPPAPLFTYRDPDDALGAGARVVRDVRVDFGVWVGAPANWRWNAIRGGFTRHQSGTPHVDERGRPIAPENVVIQFVDYYANGDVDSGGGAVYEAAQVGAGTCWILTDGHVVEGVWEKTSDEAVTTYVDTDGNPIALTPGRTWVELTPPGGAQIVR